MMKQIPPIVENTGILARSSRRIIRSLKAKADAKRTNPEIIADWATARLGSIYFLLANGVWFLVWISINIGVIPGVKPFDPYPFGLLTTTVSLEAIILAILVLISQNRASQIDDLREEIDLQVDIIAEQELTKLMKMTKMLMEKNGIDVSGDQELEAMLKPANVDKIEKILEKQVLENHQIKF